MVEWLLWQRMAEMSPLCVAALTQQRCSVLLVQTFLSPSLGPSPETWAGSAKQERPHLLQSWLPSRLSVMAYLYHVCSGADGSSG